MITSSLSQMVQTFPMRDGLDGGSLQRLAFTFAFCLCLSLDLFVLTTIIQTASLIHLAP